jgi:hypothetical protein
MSPVWWCIRGRKRRDRGMLLTKPGLCTLNSGRVSGRHLELAALSGHQLDPSRKAPTLGSVRAGEAIYVLVKVLTDETMAIQGLPSSSASGIGLSFPGVSLMVFSWSLCARTWAVPEARGEAQ